MKTRMLYISGSFMDMVNKIKDENPKMSITEIKKFIAACPMMKINRAPERKNGDREMSRRLNQLSRGMLQRF